MEQAVAWIAAIFLIIFVVAVLAFYTAAFLVFYICHKLGEEILREGARLERKRY